MSDGDTRPPARPEPDAHDPAPTEPPAGAPSEEHDGESSRAMNLPGPRAHEPPPGFRRTPKEEWEPQQRALRRPEFAERVARITEGPPDPDAPVPPKPPPRRTGAVTWDQERPHGEIEAAEEAAEPALSRSQVWVLAGLSALVVVLGVAWVVKELFGSRDGPVPGAFRPAIAEEGAERSPEVLSEAAYTEAVGLAKQFLTSPTREEFMPLIRDPERVRPLMDAFYKDVPWQPFVVRSVAPRSEFQTNGEMLAGIVELGNFEKEAVAFVRTPEGIKLDWEAFVGFGEMAWDELGEERPTHPVLMRVHLTPDDYYNLDFKDPRTHACFRLLSRGGGQRLFGYVRRDRPFFAHLASVAKPGRYLMPTLRFRFKEAGLSSDQVEITDLISDGWVVTAAEAPPAAGGNGTPPVR